MIIVLVCTSIYVSLYSRNCRLAPVISGKRLRYNFPDNEDITLSHWPSSYLTRKVVEGNRIVCVGQPTKCKTGYLACFLACFLARC